MDFEVVVHSKFAFLWYDEMQKSFWLFLEKEFDWWRGGGLAIPQVFSYSDNKSKLSDEISENAHPPAGVPQQTQVFGPGMTIDSKFYQGFSFIIKLLESFIVVYYTHQV